MKNKTLPRILWFVLDFGIHLNFQGLPNSTALKISKVQIVI